MKLSVKVDQSTSPAELIILAGTFESLALAREGHVVSVPAEDAGDDPTPGETVVVQVPNDAHSSGAGFDAPKRRRRTKAEIEAAAAPVEPEPEAPAPTEPEQAIPPGAPGNEQPAPTPAATATDTAPAQAPAEPAAATASPSEPAPAGKEYTEAEVQDLAGKVARSVGPEVVKGKIAELGASRIAELTQPQRNELGAFLVSKLP